MNQQPLHHIRGHFQPRLSSQNFMSRETRLQLLPAQLPAPPAHSHSNNDRRNQRHQNLAPKVLRSVRPRLGRDLPGERGQRRLGARTGFADVHRPSPSSPLGRSALFLVLWPNPRSSLAVRRESPETAAHSAAAPGSKPALWPAPDPRGAVETQLQPAHPETTRPPESRRLPSHTSTDRPGTASGTPIAAPLHSAARQESPRRHPGWTCGLQILKSSNCSRAHSVTLERTR